MKAKNLAIIILMTIVFIILGTSAYATTGIINEKTVKLRKEPDSKIILDYVYKNDKVEILEHKNGWYKVKATTGIGKVTGYISEQEIDLEEITLDNKQETETPQEDEKIQTDTVETTTQEIIMQNDIKENNQYLLQQEINLKAVPAINSIEKAKISGNITVIEIINDWARIENENESGWIRKNILKQAITQQNESIQEPEKQPAVEQQPVEQPEEPKEKEETKITEMKKVGYVSAEGLRVRKEPTTDSEEIDSLAKNDKVQIVGKIDNWYKIDIKGKEGYVSAKYISDTKVPETTSRGGSTIKKEPIANTEQVKEETKQEEQITEKQPETSGTMGTDIVAYAKQYLGCKYVLGGTSPSTGFDCSGFTQYVYKHFGISINRTSSTQINNGVPVSKDNLQPGDLLIFNNEANTKIGHVGIYIGDGNFIHASNPKDGVKISSLTSGYYPQRYVTARRVF